MKVDSAVCPEVVMATHGVVELQVPSAGKLSLAMKGTVSSPSSSLSGRKVPAVH